MLKTSSLLLPNSTNNLQDLHAMQIVIYDKTGKTRHIYNNVTLAGLMKLIGKNEITINSTGKLSLLAWARITIMLAYQSHLNLI
jgi:hypothetical protein